MEHILQAPGKSLLLVQPLGIEDSDVLRLRQAMESGSNVYVVGDVDNEKLLDLLGIRKTVKDGGIHTWYYDGDILKDRKEARHGEESGLEGYAAVQADVAVYLENKDAVLTRRAVGKGQCIYIRRVMEFMPALDIAKTDKELASYPVNLEKIGAKTIRQELESVITLHPDELDFLIADCIRESDVEIPRVNRGQILGFKDPEGSQVLLIENSANLMYTTVNVKLPRAKKCIQEFPEIKPIGPVGYLFFGESEPDEFDVSVPPDAAIPVKICYQDNV